MLVDARKMVYAISSIKALFIIHFYHLIIKARVESLETTLPKDFSLFHLKGQTHYQINIRTQMKLTKNIIRDKAAHTRALRSEL